jgi:chloramphenicol O-acetyltransferase
MDHETKQLIKMEIEQILTALGLLVAIVTSYLSSNSKRVKFETEANMKFAEFERRLSEHIDANKTDFAEIWKDNKEDHVAISKDLKEVASTLIDLKLEIAKKL